MADERVPPPLDARPMLATLSDTVPTGPGWAYELKWDGIRALGLVQEGSVRLWTRNGNEVTGRYPELEPLADALGGHEAMLDGEIVTFDDQGRPSFERLQSRMHVTQPSEIARLTSAVPIVYLVFDLLWLDGRLVTGLPYTDRRKLLAGLVPDGDAWRVPPAEEGDGSAMLAVSRQFDLEGIVAKRLDSLYEPGRRTTAWRKVKLHLQQELVVGGWLSGKGARSATFGALLLGYYDETGALRYAGRVGTGFTERTLASLQAALAARERPTSPFADPLEDRTTERAAHWVEPELVAEVRLSEWTASGRIRHPVFLGLRDDKDPREVTRTP
jgi:bifunctional non-homologous end joining protein LigD